MPLVTDVPEWGEAPTMTIGELSDWGFDLGIFALSSMRVALFAVRGFLNDLRDGQTQRGWQDRMMTRGELDELVGLPDIRLDEERLERKGQTISSSLPKTS